MFDKGDRQSSRNTFVGTPCWMAPEVLQPGSGYNFKADIWSFGITALELAHGHAPFSKYPPMKVLLMTLQNAPPGLDYDRDKRFSKSFKEMVAMCLVKDQTKRPTAEKLLKHSFFKNAKPPELSVKSLLVDLPPLWDRVKDLQLKDAAQLALKKMPSAEQEALSQSEYQRGVSAWNFDIEDLKAQASLIQDDEDFAEAKEDNLSLRHFINNEDESTPGSAVEKPLADDEIGYRSNKIEEECSGADGAIKKYEHHEKDSFDFANQEDIDISNKVRLKNDSIPSTSKQDFEPRWKSQVGKKHQTYSGPLLPSSMHNNSSERGRTSERADAENILATEKGRRDSRKAPNLSGPLMLPNRASANSLSAPIRYSSGYGDSLEDKSRSNVVQIKGRFSVTSENVELVKDVPLSTIPRRSSQGSLLTKSGSVGDCLVNSKQVPLNLHEKDNINSALPASILMPHLQNLFQQTSFQQDLLTNLLNSLQQNGIVDAFQAGMPLKQQNSEEDNLVDTAVTERERLLLAKISELQTRMVSLTDELTAARMKHIQLQQQLSAVYSQEDRKEELQET
ncbi:Mitogen-activated protein kinase kinase kinase YODA [Dendrobium catenatum]|uniref:Mitogen-activated protein kinase kinase kinase YODA n=2 Tax=Dendrobium catenatum TaxID=906689 RepID=A0A2I0X944_9ASPA|nr:Mitogen-activated protein kinase kinase kinase YODA [Dendrobium catenatum]